MRRGNGRSGGNRPNPALSQRQREVLALYAKTSVGERLVRFCKRAGIHRDTFLTWRTTNPDFARELARIQQERVQIALEPLRDALPKLAEALIQKALGGDVPALRTCGDWLGLSRKAGSDAQLAADAAGVVPPEPEPRTIEEILMQRERWRGILERHFEHQANEIELPKESDLFGEENAVQPSPEHENLGEPSDADRNAGDAQESPQAGERPRHPIEPPSAP